ncbi:FG-GAP and VCBS repeat-containing protein [Streptomyces sp. NPDC046915]|uniref:FG-GAP and VCBS repeat-containing protein n=1 Tax=Streptomyces sp. NPDC046915 TaxID=3155257 RepID=UPI0033F68885
MGKHRFRPRLGLVAAVAVAGAVVGPVSAHAAGTQGAGVRSVRADFNGDGYADLAVAASWGKVGGHARAGYVSVVYGSSKGLDTKHRQVISQNTAGIPGSAEADDYFGSGLALGDLDGDGYADLVVGASGEDIGSVRNAGTLTVVWGGKEGLSGGTNVATGTEGDRVEAQHLALGDYDGDGRLDLATSTRLLEGPFTRTAGAARSAGLSFDSDYALDDLAAGDVDHDGVTDLVALIHDHSDDDSSDPDATAPRAVYLHGSKQGLGAPAVLKKADGTRVRGGSSLGIGDVNKDGYADLVIGRPLDGSGETPVDPALLGGQVGVVYGSAAGPDTSRTTVINQNTAGVPGASEAGDGFGWGVSVADVNGDGYADVAAGSPNEDIGKVASAGAVTVLRGGKGGLTGAGAVSFNQDTAGVPGTAEQNDFFGSHTALADTDHDGRAELYVGAPGENTFDGAAWAFRSTGTGPTASGSASFGPATLGAPVTDANFGDGFAR